MSLLSFIHVPVGRLPCVLAILRTVITGAINAVHELIKQFKQKYNFDYDDQLVARFKNTDTQTGKSKLQRRQNVRYAFTVNKAFQADHIMLVDEVVTTGATVNELSRCLKKAGARKVSVWALARTRSIRKLQGKPITCSNA